MAIRMNLKTSREIYSTINAFNRKVQRLNKKGGYDTPDEVTFEDVLREAQNRKELNRTLASLRLYSKRGIEESVTTKGGYETSKYNLTLLKQKQSRNRQKITRRLNSLSKIKPTTYGKKESNYTYAQMGDSNIENLKLRQEKLRKDIETMSPSYIRDYANYLDSVDSIDYNIRDKAYMNSYLNEMIFNLGKGVGYNQDKIETMREKILTNLSDNEIVEMMKGEEAIKSLSEWYPVLHEAKIINEGNISLIQAEYDELYNNLDKIIKYYKK